LTDKLQSAVSGVRVHEPLRWVRDMQRATTTVKLIAFGLILVIGVTTMLTVMFSTRSALVVHADEVELLHIIGATDSYIARQFQMESMQTAFKGGVLGLGFCLLTLILLYLGLGHLRSFMLPGLL